MIDNRTVTTQLDGRHASSSMFAKAKVEPDQIYVKESGLYTIAGVTAGIDLALITIEEDFVKKMALAVVKYLIVYVRRAGGQSRPRRLPGGSR